LVLAKAVISTCKIASLLLSQACENGFILKNYCSSRVNTQSAPDVISPLKL
jgi:hypothetical protein